MTATTTAIREDSLTVRARDPEGRPQMAEGQLPKTGGITPTDELFVVHHYPPHEVTPESWSLDIALPGGGTTRVHLDDLKALPVQRVTALLECAGMSRGFLTKKTPGTQFGHGLVGTGQWRGARLADVLSQAGLTGQFGSVIVRGGDSGSVPPENEHSDFSKALPVEKALHEDTILAYELNGEALPWLHGGPVRVVVPGWFGVWWVKWPRRIETSSETAFDGFWQSARYTYQSDDGTSTGVVREGLPRAIIQAPEDGTELKKGTIELSGLAWAGDQPVAKVEVTADGGKTWHPATLTEDFGRWTWRRWTAMLEVNGPPGFIPVAARCTDVTGRTQDWHSTANRLGYGNNDIHSVRLNVTA